MPQALAASCAPGDVLRARRRPACLLLRFVQDTVKQLAALCSKGQSLAMPSMRLGSPLMPKY